VQNLEKMRHTDGALAKQVAEQLYDQSLAAAGLLEDPRTMIARMTSLLEKLLSNKS
jgi:TNF receptor-associated protein 1